MDNTYKKELALYKSRNGEISFEQKRYRVVGLVMLCVTVGLVLMRLLMQLVYPLLDKAGVSNEYLTDFLFTVPLQVGILFVMPLLVYRFALKMSFKQVFAFSKFKSTKWYNYLLAIPLGICCLFVTMGVSSVWQMIISLLGYTHSIPSDSFPAQFNILLFFLSVFLTGILPGFCEEFTSRGGFLTTMRGSFPFVVTVVIAGIQFGLFHQFVVQVFYTACFGALMGFLTLKLKSIFPAMIMHFVNNTLSVYLDYASFYGFVGGDYNEVISSYLLTKPILVFMAFFAVLAAAMGIVFLLLHLNSNKRLEKKKKIISESGFDHTNNRVVLLGAEDKELVREVGLEKEVYGQKIKENLYKPTLRDNVFFIGAIVVAVANTLFTFIFGWIV